MDGKIWALYFEIFLLTIHFSSNHLGLLQDVHIGLNLNNPIVLFITVQSKKLKKILTLRQTTNSIWNNFEKFQFEKFMMLFMEFPTIQFPSQLLSKSLHTVSSTAKLNKGLDSKRIFTTIWSPSSRLWRMVLKIDSMYGGKIPKDSSFQNFSIV